MKKWIALAALLLLVLGAVYLGSPIYAARSLQQAALAGDEERIESLVDFPAVRDALRPQLSEAIMARVQRDPGLRDSAIARLGMLVLPGLADRALDLFVTPSGIAALIQGRHPGEQGSTDVDRNAEYVGLDHFRISLRDTKRNAPGPVFLLERRGFASWKLVRVDLPPRWLGERPG